MTTPRQRDRSLDRVSRITRWSIVGAAAATGLFGFLLARPTATAAKATATGTTDDQSGVVAGSGATPTTRAGSSGSSSSAGSSTSGSTSRSSRTTPQPQAPSQAPQRSSRSSRATSGGS